ncbi:MAG: leucine-rich repeat domain-containing protein [Clostridia bacterium]
MKIKFKIISTAMSMCLAFVIMGFAVWAASTQTLSVTNTVNFTSIHVLSTVTGTVAGAKAETFANYGPVSTLAGDEEGKLGTWAIGSAMEFADETEPIVITLTIVNNSDERSLSFELSGQAYAGFNGTNLGDTNIDRTCVYSINNATPVTNATYTSGTINIEALKTATIVMTLDISDNGKSVTAFNNSFSATLRNVGEGFTFNTGSGEQIEFITSEPITYQNIPAMSVENSPALYGLYFDSQYTNKIELPYSGPITTIYAKFGNPADDLLEFTLNEAETEYSVKSQSVISEEMGGMPVATTTATILEIPALYNGKPVSEIAEMAFMLANSLIEVKLPTTITKLGMAAFYSCTGLTSFTIPDSVTSIGDAAFAICTGLTCFAIPNTVTILGGSLLQGCSSLETLTAPFTSPFNRVTNSHLKYYFQATEGDEQEIPSSLKIVNISDGTVAIEHAFYGCAGLTNITLPTSLTSIGGSTFYGCTGLTNIIIPSGVTSIENSSFENCTGLTNFTIPSNVTSIGNFSFKNCTLLTNVTIESGLLSIGESAFSNCIGLTSVAIPSGVTSIGASAFELCSGLTSIIIPNSVSTVGTNVLFYCSALETLTAPFKPVYSTSNNSYLRFYFGGTSYNSGYSVPTSLKTVNISNGTTSIGDSAFNSCTSLTSVTIPNSVTNIGNQSFLKCSELSSIIIPEGVLSIGNWAFGNCSNLASVIFPDSLTTINAYAFADSNNLKNLKITKNVISIGKEAFYVAHDIVVIDSATIAQNLIDQVACGYILALSSSKELFILDSISTIGAYVINTSNFHAPVVVEIEGVNYKKFVKV